MSARSLKPEQVVFFTESDGKPERIESNEYLASRRFDLSKTIMIAANDDGALAISQGGHGLCLGPDDWMYLGD